MRLSARTVSTVLLLGILIVGPSSIAVAAAPVPTPGPADIAVPYGEVGSIKPAAPWSVADCAAVRAESDVVRSCAGDIIEVGFEDFDPDAAAVPLAVELTNGSGSMTVTYRVRAEAPVPPETTRAPEAKAVPAGGLLRVPLSEFGLQCTLCAEGGSTRIEAIDPEDAGEAWTTPTHVVFRPAASTRGEVSIHLSIADDVGSPGVAVIPVRVYSPVDDDPLVALDVRRPLAEDGTLQVQLDEVASARSAVSKTLVGCSAPLHGTVTCDENGTMTYRGDGSLDQFGFQVVSHGEQAYGSVLVVPAGESAGIVPPSPVDGSAPVSMLLVPSPPPENAEEELPGILHSFTQLLNRVEAQ